MKNRSAETSYLKHDHHNVHLPPSPKQLQVEVTDRPNMSMNKRCNYPPTPELGVGLMIRCATPLICIWPPLLSSKNNFDGQTFPNFKPPTINLGGGIIIGSAPSYAHDPNHVHMPSPPLKQSQIQVEIKDANFRLRHLFGEKHFFIT